MGRRQETGNFSILISAIHIKGISAFLLTIIKRNKVLLETHEPLNSIIVLILITFSQLLTILHASAFCLPFLAILVPLCVTYYVAFC